MTSQRVSEGTFFQAKRSHCLSSSSVLVAGSLFQCLVNDNPDGLEGSHHVSLPAGRPLLESYQILLAPCLHVRRLFLFKAFQPLLVIYLHTVVLESLKF